MFNSFLKKLQNTLVFGPCGNSKFHQKTLPNWKRNKLINEVSSNEKNNNNCFPLI